LGPGDPSHPDFGEFCAAAPLVALDRENAAGRLQKQAVAPRSVVVGEPVVGAVVDLTRSIYERGAWAVIAESTEPRPIWLSSSR